MKIVCRAFRGGTGFNKYLHKIEYIDVNKFTLYQLENLLTVAINNDKLSDQYRVDYMIYSQKLDKFKNKVKSLVDRLEEINIEYKNNLSILHDFDFGTIIGFNLGCFSTAKIEHYKKHDLSKEGKGQYCSKDTAKSLINKLDCLAAEYKKYNETYEAIKLEYEPKYPSSPKLESPDCIVQGKKIYIRSTDISVEIINNALAEKNKNQVILAKAAAHDNNQRILANSIKIDIKNQIKLMSICPYCGCKLIIKSAHADHIYPVAKGGLSTTRNMVYICLDCNIKKSDMTLRYFIKKYSYDADFIHNNLESLGKDF